MLKKIQRLEENLMVLENIYTQNSLEDITTNTADQWAIRYGICPDCYRYFMCTMFKK